MKTDKEVEDIADSDYEAMLKRTEGNPNVVFLLGKMSHLLGVSMLKNGMTDQEAVMFRDEMNILINRMLEGFE